MCEMLKLSIKVAQEEQSPHQLDLANLNCSHQLLFIRQTKAERFEQKSISSFKIIICNRQVFSIYSRLTLDLDIIHVWFTETDLVRIKDFSGFCFDSGFVFNRTQMWLYWVTFHWIHIYFLFFLNHPFGCFSL